MDSDERMNCWLALLIVECGQKNEEQQHRLCEQMNIKNCGSISSFPEHMLLPVLRNTVGPFVLWSSGSLA